jgi:hypothetical protein
MNKYLIILHGSSMGQKFLSEFNQVKLKNNKII